VDGVESCLSLVNSLQHLRDEEHHICSGSSSSDGDGDSPILFIAYVADKMNKIAIHLTSIPISKVMKQSRGLQLRDDKIVIHNNQLNVKAPGFCAGEIVQTQF